jgi:hypothetical protein
LPSFKDGKDFTSPLNWTDAQDFCTKLNIPDMIYNLVSLQDKNEYDFVLSYDWSELYKTYKETFAIWIGLNDIDEEDDWRWSDNSPLKYPIASNLPWIKNEPNNHNVCISVIKISICFNKWLIVTLTFFFTLIINKKCVTIVFLRTMKIASGQKVFWG